MTNGVTNRQMVFILFLSVTSLSIVSIAKTMVEHAGVGSWVALLLAAIVFGAAAVVIAKLNNMYQGKVLFDYSGEIVGKVGSKIIGFYYMIYFLIIATYLCACMSNILSSNFLLKTPPWANTLIGLPFYGYAAYKGITNIARLFELYGIVFVLTALVVHFVMLLQGKVEYILPLFNPAETLYYVAAVKNTVLPFLGIEILTIIPFTAKNNRNAPKIAFWTVIGIGLFYVLVVESCVMMIGVNEIIHYNSPLISAIRQVEIPFLDFLRRIDIVYNTVGFMGVFAAKTIMYAGALEFTCRLFPKVKRSVLSVEIGIAIALLVLIVLDINNFGEIFQIFGSIMGLTAMIFIPTLLFLIAKVRKRVEKK